MVPEIAAALVRKWAAARITEHVQNQIRIEVDEDPRSLTILECWPLWDT